MGPIYGFMLFAVLIGGSALVSDKANGATDLPEQVVLIHSEIQTYSPESGIFKEYLRHGGYEQLLPTTISYRVDCYSDGSGRLHQVQGITDIHRALTSEGRDLLRVVLQDVGYYTCTSIWEQRYETGTLDEGTQSWYF